jgi:hypothetical protein
MTAGRATAKTSDWDFMPAELRPIFSYLKEDLASKRQAHCSRTARSCIRGTCRGRCGSDFWLALTGRVLSQPD